MWQRKVTLSPRKGSFSCRALRGVRVAAPSDTSDVNRTNPAKPVHMFDFLQSDHVDHPLAFTLVLGRQEQKMQVHAAAARVPLT